MVDLLIVSRSFFPKEGGAERQLRQVAERLCHEGQSVTVLTESRLGLPANETLPGGVRVERVGARSPLGRHSTQFFFVVAALRRGLRLRPAGLVSPQLGAASTVAGIIARILRRPHIVRLTGGGTEKFRSEPLAKSSTRTGRAIASVFCRPATTIVAPAKHLLADFSEAFPHHPCALVHITNGVNIAGDIPPKSREVVWYSRAGSESSLSTFLQIAHALPEVRFSVIGQEIGADTLENVDDLGWQIHPELTIAKHRVLLNTSPREGMPNTVLQALAVGCRVVGFRNAGMNELQAQHPDVMELVAVGDIRAATEALTRAVDAALVAPAKITTISEVVDQWIATIRPQLEARA